MAKMTSAQAAKELKRLNELHTALLDKELKASVFTAAIQEDIEMARPEYCYGNIQTDLRIIEEKIISLKHSINQFNLTYMIEGFDMTIDQMLVYIPQLTARKKKLEKMASRLSKERINNGFARSSNFIEYTYCNYEVSDAKYDLEETAKELAAAQMALDLLLSGKRVARRSCAVRGGLPEYPVPDRRRRFRYRGQEVHCDRRRLQCGQVLPSPHGIQLVAGRAADSNNQGICRAAVQDAPRGCRIFAHVPIQVYPDRVLPAGN